MNKIQQAIDTLADALMTIPVDYPRELRLATYKKSLEGLARLVRTEKFVDRVKAWGAVAEDMRQVEQIRKSAMK